MLDQIADAHEDPHMEDCFTVKFMILINKALFFFNIF